MGRGITGRTGNGPGFCVSTSILSLSEFEAADMVGGAQLGFQTLGLPPSLQPALFSLSSALQRHCRQTNPGGMARDRSCILETILGNHVNSLNSPQKTMQSSTKF